MVQLSLSMQDYMLYLNLIPDPTEHINLRALGNLSNSCLDSSYLWSLSGCSLLCSGPDSAKKMIQASQVLWMKTLHSLTWAESCGIKVRLTEAVLLPAAPLYSVSAGQALLSLTWLQSCPSCTSFRRKQVSFLIVVRVVISTHLDSLLFEINVWS